MNLIELQILFQRKIEDVNPVFKDSQRPDSFTIENYLNKAIDRYLISKFLKYPSFEQRILAIEENQDELHLLFRVETISNTPQALTELNWGARGIKFPAPEWLNIPISMSCTVTRERIYPVTAEKMFVDFVSRRQAEKIVSNSTDKVMLPRPLGLWEDTYELMIIGDAYTTAIITPILTYLKKPFTLSHRYTEIITEGATNVSAITDGTYFIVHTRCTYRNDAGAETIYEAGSKVKKQVAYEQVTLIEEDLKIGYPYGYADTPEFPEYVHDELVDGATALFLEEAKLKLIPQSSN